MAFVTGQEFQETPNGVLTTFTTALEFVGGLIVTQGGLVAHNFTTPDSSTVEFDTAPIAADGELRWSGYTVSEGIEDEYIVGIEQRIHDDESRLSAASVQACLLDALAEYNRRRPNQARDEQTGDGSYFLDVPDDWEEGFSTLIRLDELDSEDVPTEIRRNRIQLEQRPSLAPRLMRTYGYFEIGVTYRVAYTLKHTITAHSSSVPSEDKGAVMDLAASYACTRLAAAYAQSVDPQIGTVTIDYKSKTQEYRQLAKDYLAAFDRVMTTRQSATGLGKMKTWTRESPLLLHP